jgi:hypothetical protein
MTPAPDVSPPSPSAPPTQPQTTPHEDPAFLDPNELIERSQPVPRAGIFWYMVGGFAIVVVTSTIAGGKSAEAQAAVRMLAGLVMVFLMVGLSILTWYLAQRQRDEQRQLEAIEELVQLRRWPEAAVMLQAMLSAASRTPQARVQALIYLSAVLARYHRFADAMVVQQHLLDNVNLEDGTAYALRLGRAMALLHEDRLVDADRAINELRRVEGSGDSAGLALLQIYRDVKTGHPGEAIELFSAKQPLLRKQLGHRVADAWALIAKAYDMVGHEDDARHAYHNATLLAPIAEISRKYTEVATLTSRYDPAVAPAE